MSSKTLLDFKSLVSDATSSLCGNFLNSLLKFPATFYTWLASVAETGGDIRGVAKIGDYRFSASPLLEDSYWKLANGQAISRTTYADLFTLIGVVYGVGDNSTTFNLPNAGARSLIGVGALPSTTAIALGDTLGEEKHELLEVEMPEHDHFVFNEDSPTEDNQTPTLDIDNYACRRRTADGGTNYAYAISGTDTLVTQGLTSTRGGDGGVTTSHNNIHPVIGAYIYIRVA